MGDPALLFNGDLGKRLFPQLKDRIVPEPVVPPGIEGDCSFQRAGEDPYAAFISIGNPGGEPGFEALFFIVNS